MTWSGVESKMRIIINKLKEVFQISHEDDDAFKYIGWQISNCNITIDQTSYAASVRNIVLDQKKMTAIQSELTNDEITMLRGALGQLNWLANMSRPDISFMV